MGKLKILVFIITVVLVLYVIYTRRQENKNKEDE